MYLTSVTRPVPLVALVLCAAVGCDAAYGNEQPALEARPDESAEARRYRDRNFSVDVVADCNRFISGGVPHPMANPKFGDTFMQEGLMYEGGTLAKNCNGDGCGLKPDGSPEFPEAVIGKWTCYGTFVGNGAATGQGTWVYTTQVYEFDAEKLEPNIFAPGEHAIVSLGPERNDLATPWSRAISGGYGRFRSALGQVVQTKIGLNPTTCENFTFDFKVDYAR